MQEYEKMADPVPSAATDGEQPLLNGSESSIAHADPTCNRDYSDEEAELETYYDRLQDPSYLPTITMQELYNQSFAYRQPVIEGLLYTGAYLLAGAPKVGKSFLVAQIAYHVSSGIPLWSFPVRKGVVLYMALEDDQSRLQARLFRMFGSEITENLYFSTTAKQIGKGLAEQLNRFVSEHRDTRLIIIDTLQRVRETSESYSYSNDYYIAEQLKLLADVNSICLLIVHHTRKQLADDKLEMVSGTNGLTGAADGGMVLYKQKRTDSKAVLQVTGRDQPDQCLYLDRNPQTLAWELISTETEPWKEPPDPLLEKLAAFLTNERKEWAGSATELRDALEASEAPNALTYHLNVKRSFLLQTYHIRYDRKHTRNGSRIVLSLEM